LEKEARIMLELHIPEVDLYDEKTEMFYNIRGQKLRLEHSLVSLAKWESRWERPFLSKEPMTIEQITHYIKCMTISQNVESQVYSYLAKFYLNEIYAYMELPMTATTFSKQKEPWRGSTEIVTAEIIYFWMAHFNISIECQKWHLNRLITLINVCNLKSQSKKPMSKADILKRNHALNQQRLKKLGTTG
jgi:hypothetical protein